MNSTIKGSILIAAAACCYGMLGTFVKMAYLDGYTTAEVTVSQFGLGFICLLTLHYVKGRKIKTQVEMQGRIKSHFKLVVAGSSLGLTSICYYMAVKHIAVSVGIVLLLQAVWMSTLLESIIQKKRPGALKLVSIFVVLTGTILATGIFQQKYQFSWVGIGWGLGAALCYTATMYSSNHLQLQLLPLTRSFLMVSGGLIVVLLAFLPAFSNGFSMKIFLGWGLLVSVFGTILPPILFTKGMPQTGVALGAMLTTLEVPVSILFAYFMLGESISLIQWLGIVFILSALILIKSHKN